jgi:cellulose synthase/poly-beta-1,6-N-acetylglucosamine synthase-like glycosyltransferase
MPLVQLLLIGVYSLSAGAILFTYIGYPLSLWLLARNKPHLRPEVATNELPAISILLAVYNEVEILEEKINNLFAANYTTDRIELLIGTDACTDGTVELAQTLAQQDSRIRIIEFRERTGKPNIINALAEQARNPILVLTDARARFYRDTLLHLLRPFARPEVGLVSAALENFSHGEHGVARQEKKYFGMEAWIKDLESRWNGCMIGSFGSCYALRSELYQPTPPRFIADDFYISMQVLASGNLAILEPLARCRLSVNDEMDREFRRKKRIAVGNFQNLFELKNLLWSQHVGLSYCYFGHKVLRWITPLLLILCWFLSGALALEVSYPFVILFGLQTTTLLLALVDAPLARMGISTGILRYITHFYAMNLALLAGFAAYLAGVNSNVWEPTRRLV